MGYRVLALTDINNLYGVHDFLDACAENGVRPVVGAEIRSGAESAAVYAKTREGFSNLTQLITGRMMDEGFAMRDALERYGGGTAVVTGSPGLLADLAGRVDDLSAGITPRSAAVAREARDLGIPLVAAGQAVFLSKEDRAIQRVLRAIAHKKTVYQVTNGESAPADAFLRPPAETAAGYLDFPQAVRNAQALAERCEFDEIFDGWIFPLYGNDAAGELRQRTLTGAEARYGDLSDTALERIEYELGIITAKGFAPYFLVVADIARLASRICGRGSAAASVVAYALGITNVDPIEHNLYFERFLNPERSDPPDIDLDFAWDERDGIIAEVMRRHGKEHSAMVCTQVHFQARASLRETARAFGMPDTEISSFERGLFRSAGPGAEIDASWREILHAASRITGFPRHLGVHVGGVVITPRPVSRYAPVERAAKGVPIITWDKDDAEKAGFVKIDLLGNRSLAVVRDAIANLAENGVEIESARWRPADDPAAQELLARGESMGVFYVESPAMRQLQKKTGRGDFEHLVIHSSIIRPAANRFITEYVRRLRGEPYEPLHPVLGQILRETYGIMVYQEDVSKAAVALAGFTPAEADGLRKVLTKKNREAKLAAYREQFFTNAAIRGVGTETIEAIWEMIQSFDGYSFCKPHSASYAIVSFQSAYLKVHHPAAFMAAVLSNGGGFYTASAYVSEARRMGLTVLPPHINESRVRYTGKGGEVRVGFMAVGRLSCRTVAAILREREANGPFFSIEDLVRRVPVPPPDAEALVACGALDQISGDRNRAEQLWALCSAAPAEDEKGAPLFAAEPVPARRRRPPAPRDILDQEYGRLGFLCAGHPLSLWEKKLAGRSPVRASAIPAMKGRDIRITGWFVTRKPVLASSNQPMEFVSFEDETGIFETVLFPRAYREYGEELEEERPYVIRGRVEDDMGAVYINVRELKAVK
jgi:DNA polymerase-3 subunit alpha/error-prone DNA polymerase